MNNIKLIILVLLAGLVLFQETGFANNAKPFSNICTVKNYGDKEDKAVTEFGWDDTPWLYLRLPTESGFVLKTKVYSDWHYGDDSDPSGTKNGSRYLSGLYEYWLKLDNWWDEETQSGVKKAGSWSILASFDTYYNSTAIIASGEGSTTFTVLSNVVPEPISSALFLLGGTLLVIRQYRKKKHV